MLGTCFCSQYDAEDLEGDIGVNAGQKVVGHDAPGVLPIPVDISYGKGL